MMVEKRRPITNLGLRCSIHPNKTCTNIVKQVGIIARPGSQDLRQLFIGNDLADKTRFCLGDTVLGLAWIMSAGTSKQR